MELAGLESESVGPSEHERSGIVDRDRTRSIARLALARLLDVVISAPPDSEPNLEMEFAVLRSQVLPVLREYRTRQKQRFAQAAASTGLLR